MKLENDCIYFVESGEFVAYSTTFTSSHKQDIQQENLKNKNFLSETIKTHSTLSPERKNQSYRNIIRNDKFKSLTRKPNLLREQPVERQERELIKFGRGKMFGDIRQIIKLNYDHDPELQEMLASPDTLPQFVSIKCNTVNGRLLKISAIDFQKKILSHYKHGKVMLESAKERIKLYKQQSNYMQIQRSNFNLEFLSAVKEEPRSPSPLSEVSSPRSAEKQTQLDFHDMLNKNVILNKNFLDKRDVLKEIIKGYPETHRTVILEEQAPKRVQPVPTKTITISTKGIPSLPGIPKDVEEANPKT